MYNHVTDDTEATKPLLDEKSHEETKYDSSDDDSLHIDDKHKLDDSNYNLDAKLRTEQQLKDFIQSSMIVLSDFDVLRIYISTPISKLYNIIFIIINMIHVITDIDNINDLSYLEKGSKLVITVEFIGLIIILSSAVRMCCTHNWVTFIDSLQLSGSFSTFQLFYQCRPRAIIQYISTVYKNNNALETNIQKCETWLQIMKEDSFISIGTDEQRAGDHRQEIEDKIEDKLNKYKEQLETENIKFNHFMKESAYGLIILFIFLGLALGLLSLILKLSQLKFIINSGDIIDWGFWDWFACIGFANQLWNMVNINQIKSFAVYDLLYTNKQNISRFTKAKMNKMLYLDSLLKTKLMETFKWKGVLIAISLKYKHVLQFLIKNQHERERHLKFSMVHDDAITPSKKLSTTSKTQEKTQSFLSKLKLSNKIQIDAVAEAKLFCENEEQIDPEREYKINDYFPNFSFIFEKIETRLIQFFYIIGFLSIIICIMISLMSVIMFKDDLDIDNVCDHEIFAISIVITLALIIGLLIIIYLLKNTDKSNRNKHIWYIRGLKIIIVILSVVIISTFVLFMSQDCLKHINDSRYYHIEYVAILVNLCILVVFISPILIHALFNPAKVIAVIFTVILLTTILSDGVVSFSMGFFLITNFGYGELKADNYYVIAISAILIYYIFTGFYFLYKCICTENYLSHISNLEWPKSLNSHNNIKFATLAAHILLIFVVIWNDNNDEYAYHWAHMLLFYSAVINCPSWFLTIIPCHVIFESSVDFIMYHYWFIFLILLFYSLSDVLIYILSISIVIDHFILDNQYLYQDIGILYLRSMILVVIMFSLHLLITFIKSKCCGDNQVNVLNKIEFCFAIVLDIIYLIIIGLMSNDYKTLMQNPQQYFAWVLIIIFIFVVLIGQILAIILKCLQRSNIDMKILDAISHPRGPFTVLRWVKILPNKRK